MAAVEDLTGKFGSFSIRKEKTQAAWTGSSPATQLLRREDHTRPKPPPPSQAKRPFNEEKEDAIKGRAPSQDDEEVNRLKKLVRKKSFELIERVKGRPINLLEGLELHCNVFNPMEQKKIVDCIYDFQEKGRRGELRERTYSEPRKWMRGKGRVTIQFGCCYNYAVDKDGNPPGIIRDQYVDPIPPLLKNMIKRMVAWHVLPPTCIPNSCIVNIYDKDDCIPPHIDHHDFLRPFCTVSFLTECNILFGSELKVLGPGDFSGSTAISLPLGSVLILNGNGADVAKHCVPAVPARRISITFRKMDESKIPYKFKPDPELQNLRPLVLGKSPSQQVGVSASPVQRHQAPSPRAPSPGSNGSFQGQKDILQVTPNKSGSPFQFGDLDFPPLGSSSSSGRRVTRSIRQ